MLSDGNQTDGNILERFLTPYQNSRLSLNFCGPCEHGDGLNFQILRLTIEPAIIAFDDTAKVHRILGISVEEVVSMSQTHASLM